MVTDHLNLFCTNHELLTDISQFNSALTNHLLSMNEKDSFYRKLFSSSNALMKQELSEYKVFDC